MAGTDQRARLRGAVESVVGNRFADGNRVEVLRNGVEIFPAMLEAIAAADRTIEFVTFVYWTGDIARRVAAALTERARAGVRVRVVLDAFGSSQMDDALVDQMRAAGAAVERFRPLVRWKVWEADHRTHRKILICDDRVAFTGGVGIAAEWEGDARNPQEWRDTQFRIEGPAVLGLRAAFITDWRDTGHRIEPSDIVAVDPSPAGSIPLAVVDGSAQIGFNDAERMIEAVIAAAGSRIAIQTPYFNPTDTVIDLLLEARRRGVEVEVLLPGPHVDKRVTRSVAAERCTPLGAAGAKVWVYQPTMMHTKAVLVDGELAVVGSVNVNRRSTEKDEEVAVAVLDSAVVSELEDHFGADRARSQLMQEPPAWRRWLGTLLRPFRREM